MWNLNVQCCGARAWFLFSCIKRTHACVYAREDVAQRWRTGFTFRFTGCWRSRCESGECDAHVESIERCVYDGRDAK